MLSRACVVAVAALAILTACRSGTDAPEPTGPRALRSPVELRVVTATGAGPCPGSLKAPAGGAVVPLESTCLAVEPPALTVTEVSSLVVQTPGTGWSVAVALVPEQRAAWTDVTRRAAGKQLAIVVGGRAYSAPIVQEEIPDGRFQISVDDEAAARQLETLLTG